MKGGNKWKVGELLKIMETPFEGRGLTEHQAPIARLAAFGYTTEEIAEELGLKKNSVGSHLRNVKVKTGLGTKQLMRDLVRQIQEVLK